MIEEKPKSTTATEAEVAKRYFGSFAADYHEAFRGGGESTLHRIINKSFRRRTFERRTADVERVLREFGIAGKTVVDIGCGSGEVSLLAGRLGARVVGLDIVEDMVQIARSEASRQSLADCVEFRVFDMVTQPLPPSDVVLMVGVIEYYSDIEGLLSKVASATRELMIIVDTRGPLWRRTLRYGLARLKRFNLYYHPPAVVAATVMRHGFRQWRLGVGHSYTLFAFIRQGTEQSRNEPPGSVR